ncbi:MAG: MazG nucleotide pyrophosphohydrolase domain-containing protein [Patescibacteria group bacterium]
MSSEKREEIKKELGDVLWYISQLSTELNIDLEDVAKTNLEKLLSRQKRNVLGGSGDNR